MLRQRRRGSEIASRRNGRQAYGVVGMSEASNRIGDTPTGGLVRFAAPHGATRAEMRDWLANSEFGKPLYETGDCLLVWANEGDLFACGLIHDTALAAAKAEGIREGMMKAAEMVAPSVPDCECIDCAKAEVYAAAIREAAGDAA